MRKGYKLAKEFVSGDMVLVKEDKSGKKFYAIFYSTNFSPYVWLENEKYEKIVVRDNEYTMLAKYVK